MQSLARLKREGIDGQIPTVAANAAASLAPANHNRLTDRLTALGMMMAPNRPSAEATVWLNEMTRLLSDLPEDILADAIDGLVKSCKFLPTCAEIREIADEAMIRRRTVAAQLDAMARLIASGVRIPDLPRASDPPKREPDKPMTAAEVEEMNAILGRVGAATRYHPDGRRYEVARDGQTPVDRGPLRKPTRADYIALGVDPSVLDSPNP